MDGGVEMFDFWYGVKGYSCVANRAADGCSVTYICIQNASLRRAQIPRTQSVDVVLRNLHNYNV